MNAPGTRVKGDNAPTFKGGCACGAVRFEATAKPKRSGLCHCLTCRKNHGSVFNPFVVFRFEDVFIAGALQSWRSSDHATRLSCATCASPVCYLEDDHTEIELNFGSFDDPSLFIPQYENWVVHREDWLPALGIPRRLTDTAFETKMLKPFVSH